MLLSTVGDARAAMLQLNSDIQATATQVAATYASSNGLTQAIGGNMVEEAAAQVLQGLASTWLDVNNRITGDDSDPLSDDQIAALRTLQSEVIDDRAAVGRAISSVDWTYGDFAADVATQTANLFGQAVSKVADLTGINWTWVKIGLAVGAGAVVFYAGWRVFR